jgi:hypothetical protein
VYYSKHKNNQGTISIAAAPKGHFWRPWFNENKNRTIKLYRLHIDSKGIVSYPFGYNMQSYIFAIHKLQSKQLTEGAK